MTPGMHDTMRTLPAMDDLAHAVDVAMDMVVHGFNEKIRGGLAQIAELGVPTSAPAAA